jgi:hypothetical protein
VSGVKEWAWWKHDHNKQHGHKDMAPLAQLRGADEVSLPGSPIQAGDPGQARKRTMPALKRSFYAPVIDESY